MCKSQEELLGKSQPGSMHLLDFQMASWKSNSKKDLLLRKGEVAEQEIKAPSEKKVLS